MQSIVANSVYIAEHTVHSVSIDKARAIFSELVSEMNQKGVKNVCWKSSRA